MDATHLKRRHQTWYVRLAVPPTLQKRLGRAEIVRSLRTRDLREANRRKHRVLSELKEFLARAEANAALPPEAAESFLAAARELRAAVDRGETTEQDAEVALDAALEEHLEAAGRKHGVDRDGDPKVPEEHVRVIHLARRVLHKGDVTLLSEARERYLAETAKRVRKQTLRAKARVLDEFARWLGRDRDVTEVTKRIAGRYVSDVLTQRGHAPKTIKDTLGDLSAFFAWLEGRGEVEFNPWRGVSRTVKDTTRGTRPKRRPWTDEELQRLLEGIPTDDPLWSMTAIAAYTGMRREEIANLKVEEAEGDAIRVTEGKTAAAIRTIPVHPVIAGLVKRLREKSSDGYVIPRLLRGGADGKRGHYVGKRFGHAMKRLGFTDKALTFHTLRNSFMQRCEEAGVPESTVKLLVGHARQSMTFGRYSPGVEFEGLRKAVAKVTYGEADGVVKANGRGVEVRPSQGRRHARPK